MTGRQRSRILHRITLRPQLGHQPGPIRIAQWLVRKIQPGRAGVKTGWGGLKVAFQARPLQPARTLSSGRFHGPPLSDRR